ncbi:MAG: hypothetical protein GEU80_07400 [Dehalococcoidia bacterium]|nr:hypothetical protein [Dehalococcoidia bacterium]
MSDDQNAGLRSALDYPLFEAMFNRRSRRISKGIASVPAGSLSYTSTQEPEPLTPLEEALLIAATGTTGLVLPDMPYQNERGEDVLGSPMLNMLGRTAGSPDNAQATHFFLINDSGTYFLRPPDDVEPGVLSTSELTADGLVAYAERCKVKVLDHRLDFPREFPCYLGSNRHVSNVDGSTVLVPIVDLTRQYINGFFFLFSQDPGYRPVFLDDWNFYRKAGLGKWVNNGFLNEDLPLPLGMLGSFRIPIEADLLVQNLLLTIQAMGLGGWVHAAFHAPLLLGDPEYERYGPGLQFRFHHPNKFWRRLLRPITPLPAWRPNPVGLDGLLEGCCPPYMEDMDAAVDAVLADKYGEDGVYRDSALFARLYKDDYGERFLEEVPRDVDEVIACTRAVCNYIYDTYGRFPAHVDAMHVPGIWVQAHHLDLAYYDQLFRNGYTQTQADHDGRWHSG